MKQVNKECRLVNLKDYDFRYLHQFFAQIVFVLFLKKKPI